MISWLDGKKQSSLSKDHKFLILSCLLKKRKKKKIKKKPFGLIFISPPIIHKHIHGTSNACGVDWRRPWLLMLPSRSMWFMVPAKVPLIIIEHWHVKHYEHWLIWYLYQCWLTQVYLFPQWLLYASQTHSTYSFSSCDKK